MDGVGGVAADGDDGVGGEGPVGAGDDVDETGWCDDGLGCGGACGVADTNPDGPQDACEEEVEQRKEHEFEEVEE